MKKVSIIVPIFNLEKYVEKCFHNIQQQTYKNWELIFINDGSTDNSLKICKICQAKDRRIKIISTENYGVSHARNIGIKNATGEFIMFMDGDDLIEPNTIECLVNKIEVSKADMCIAKYFYKNDDIEISTLINSDINDSKEIMKYHLTFEFVSSLCFGIYKSKIIKKIQLNEKVKNYEDWEFMTKIIYNSKKIVFIDKAFYHYISRPGSASKSKVDENKLSAFYAIENIKRLLKDSIIYKNELNVIDINVLLRIVVIYAIYGATSKKYKKKLQAIARKSIFKGFKSKVLKKKQKLYLLLISINPSIFKMMYRLKNKRRTYEKK